MQTERVLSFVFELGGQDTLMRRATVTSTVFRGNGFFIRTCLSFASPAQIYNLGHRPLPCPIPDDAAESCVPFASTAQNISDNNHLRK